MVAIQVGVFPVCVKCHNTPAIAACRGPDAGAFRLAAVFAECGAVVGYGVERIAARPGVGVGAELVC